MPDAFIVTITDVSKKFEVDLEIPAHLPLSEYKGKLLEILKMMDSTVFRDWRDYRVIFNKRTMSGHDTLAALGAFDGSRLTVERVSK